MLIIKLYKLESVEIMIFVKKRFYYVAKKNVSLQTERNAILNEIHVLITEIH